MEVIEKHHSIFGVTSIFGVINVPWSYLCHMTEIAAMHIIICYKMQIPCFGTTVLNAVGRHGRIHQENMSVCFIPPYTPLLYSEIGVYSGIHIFSYFALKHKLLVLVRTASVRRF